MNGYPASGKDAILGRVREALSHKTDAHVKGYGLADGHGEVSAEGPVSQWLPPVGDTLEAQIELFARYCETLQTRFERVPDLDAAKALVTAIAREEDWQRIGAHHEPSVEACVEAIGKDVCWTGGAEGYDADALETCDGGITTCEALIAQTGSVLVSCRGNGGRALSVLPPHHVVLATVDQVLPDLTAGYRLLQERYGEKLPSQVSLITGPSRTGDIERILVLGAHGPKKLTVVLIG